MKHCAACNRSFPDFHLVCDFDGTDLVPDQRLALIKFPPRPSLIRQFLTSPKTLAALAILGLFFIAAFIAFQQTTSRSTRTLLTANVASPRLETPAASSRRERGVLSPSADRSSIAAKTPTHARRSSPVRIVVRSRREKSNEHPSRQTEVAHRSGSVPSERQPKLVAMLKTTWRVLKRPFSF